MRVASGPICSGARRVGSGAGDAHDLPDILYPRRELAFTGAVLCVETAGRRHDRFTASEKCGRVLLAGTRTGEGKKLCRMMN